jgi:hypothetical protein
MLQHTIPSSMSPSDVGEVGRVNNDSGHGLRIYRAKKDHAKCLKSVEKSPAISEGLKWYFKPDCRAISAISSLSVLTIIPTHMLEEHAL